VSNESQSTRNGVSSEETTVTPQDLQSTNAGSPSTLGISATTAKETSPKVSQPTPNLQDIPNAVRLIQALAAKLGTLVEWKKLTLGDGREVYALCFPVRSWEVDPASNELRPK
jgi:hypothetical protein